MNELPKALLKELPQYPGNTTDYNSKELVMAYLANATEPATTSDLLIYVYKAGRVVMKRTYLYQMLYRLRKAGLVNNGELKEMEVGDNFRAKTFTITEEGRLIARPYVEVKP